MTSTKYSCSSSSFDNGADLNLSNVAIYNLTQANEMKIIIPQSHFVVLWPPFLNNAKTEHDLQENKNTISDKSAFQLVT